MSRRPRHRERDAITRMLGESEAAGGPFALLGLPAGGLADEQIVAALDRQLLRLAAHRECETPGADEVRLALHSAAAQLLDRRVREQMIAKWGDGGVGPIPLADDTPARESPAHAGDTPHDPPESIAPAPPGALQISPALRESALAAIASCGGWSAEATRRVVAIAALHGVRGDQAADLFEALFAPASSAPRLQRENPPHPAGPVGARANAAALRAPSAPRNSERAVDSDPAAAGEPLAEQQDPGQRILKYAILGGLGALLTLAAAIVLAVALIEASKAPPLPPPEPNETSPAPVAVTPEPAAESHPPPPAPVPRTEGELDADSAGREIRVCAKALETDPEQAIDGFEHALGAVAAGWVSLSPDRLVATQQDVIEFLYRAAGRADLLDRAVAALGAPAGALALGRPLTAGEVVPAAWSAGMLTRLLREKDLPASVGAQTRRLLGAALAERIPVSEQTFEAGARVAARLMPLRLVPARGERAASNGGDEPRPSIEAWDRWLAVTGALEPDAPALARAVLAALESLLADAPEPTDDELVFRAVRLLVTSVTWRSGDESRRWLLALFDDPRATSADLHAATSSIATASSAENVDVTMVVPVLASERVRAEYRQRYATAWGLGSTRDRDALLIRFEQTARDLAARADSDASPVAALATAVVYSRFNEAAWSLWAGRPDAASERLDRLSDDAQPPPASPAATSQGGGAPVNGGGDTAITVGGGGGRVRGTWAERYLAAKRNVPIRAQLLDEFPRTGSYLAAADAEVLASEAVRGTPNEIRTTAREILTVSASSSVVVNALLELLPDIPQTLANSNLIEEIAGGPLPSPSAGEWESHARRLLLERLVQLVAAEGEIGRVDALAALLAESYDARTRPPPQGNRSSSAVPAADQSAALLWRQWRDRVDVSAVPALPWLSLDEAERRRAGRLALARGRVQVFAAQQASLCELMALAIAAERPAAGGRIEAVMSQWQERRSRATHILGQIQATERAMAELWLLRVGGLPA